MADKLVCPICGEPTNSYMGNYRKDRLCRKHANDLKTGLIEQCNDCGKWHNADESCECKNETMFTELPTEGFDSCVICGTSTKGYAFCRKCFREHTEEEMLDILNGQNVPIATPTDKSVSTKSVVVETTADDIFDEQKNNVVVIDLNSKSKCITCGKQTDGLLFCSSCYHKYKSKELYFKITNCTNVELLDDDYEGKYICKDGHVVKSKSEREIDNYLFEHSISHAYEPELPYGATEKEVLHPDFYLPHYLGKDKHVYIEHWGYNENNIQYIKTKKFKMPIYEKLGITLICTYEKTDTKNIDAVLDRKLNKEFIRINEINHKDDKS